MKVRVFTVTKDEYDIIEDFILYYTALFGPGSVVVIDNGSTDQRVLDVYTKYAGVIEYHQRLGYHALSQGEHFTEIMRMHRDADWLIGLDTDEFLVVDIDKPIEPTRILSMLEWASGQKMEIVRYKKIWDCVPSMSLHRRPAREIVEFTDYRRDWKVFFRGSTFLNTSVGNHSTNCYVGPSSTNNLMDTLGLSMLHFSNGGWLRSVERAERICLGYGYISASESLAERANRLAKLPHHSMGNHRVREYLRFLTTNMFESPPPKGEVVMRYSGLKEFLCELP